MKINRLFKKWRVLLLLTVLLISLAVINPKLSVEGVAIRSVEKNSIAYNASIQTPAQDAALTDQELILEINNQKITNLEDYNNVINSIEINEVVRITTNKATYTLLKTKEDLGLTVKQPATSNLRKGLELIGGTRVLLKPEGKITDAERNDIINVMENRLNVYGLSDIKIKGTDDLTGNKFILVEIAGATREEVESLVAGQGKFEAKIKNETVFFGGEKDITFVCRNDGTCSGVRNCGKLDDGYSCRFEFEIALSQKAVKKHAEATKNLDIIDQYLSEPLDLYLDNELVDSLQISSSLRGQEITRILISGPGVGNSENEAIQDALTQMNKLQTVLITGSLPSKLEIVKIDSISPVLGQAFVKNAFLTALLVILGVGIVIFIRYRRLKITVPIMIISLSEIFIILGFAALFKQNLDLVSIAGIIAAVGTGVDDQIVITDEILSKQIGDDEEWKKRIKKAFFIIMAAYATTVAAMLPLFKAGAGLLTGFAIVTIVGVSIGVFITRPAFAVIVKTLLE